MKYYAIISALLLSFGLTGAYAQNQTKSYDASGIKVIHKTVPSDVVAVRMYIKGGTANYPREKEGVEELAFELALFGGTTEHSAEEMMVEADRLGIGLTSKSGHDYGFLGMTALKMYWNESWELWAESVGLPSMEEDDFNRIRDRAFSRNRRALNTPENALEQLSITTTFSGTDYEKIPEGSAESMYDISIDDIRNHYDKVITKTNVFLVVVGNVSEADVKEKVKNSFVNFPTGTGSAKPEKGTVRNPGVKIQHRDLDINYIQGLMPAPNRWGSEGVLNMLAMSMLSDRYIEELRNNRDLSYAPSAFANMHQTHSSNGIFVSTISPVTSVKLMVQIIDEVRKDGFKQEELDKKRNSFLTFQFLGQESLDAQAHMLGEAETGSTWQSSFGLSDAVRLASIGDVNEVFRKYNNHISWTYLGNESQVQSGDFPQPKPIQSESEEPQPEEPEEEGEKIENATENDE